MGWWSTKDGLVGDGVLDAAEDYLRSVADEYSAELGRRPALAEVLAPLAAVLRHRADCFVSDCDDKLILGLASRVKARPRKQPVSPGDIFEICLADSTLAYGRVTPQRGYFEFFKVRASRSLSVGQLRGSPTLRLPLTVGDEALEEWRWRVVGHLPYEAGEFEARPFRIGGYVACGKGDEGSFFDISSELRVASVEEATSLPLYSVVPASSIEKRLLEILPPLGEEL